MSSNNHIYQLTSIAQTLESCNEQIADICGDLLRAAIKGDSETQSQERALQRARRALAKAEQILQNLNQTEGD